MIRRDSSGTKGMCRLYRKQGLRMTRIKWYGFIRKTGKRIHMNRCVIWLRHGVCIFLTVWYPITIRSHLKSSGIRRCRTESPGRCVSEGVRWFLSCVKWKSAAYHGGASAGKIRWNGCRTSSWTAERGKHPGVRKTDPCKAGVSDPGILQIPEKGGIKDELCADQTLFYWEWHRAWGCLCLCPDADITAKSVLMRKHGIFLW